MVNGNLRGAKEQRSFKPQVGGSIPPRRIARNPRYGGGFVALGGALGRFNCAGGNESGNKQGMRDLHRAEMCAGTAARAIVIEPATSRVCSGYRVPSKKPKNRFSKPSQTMGSYALVLLVSGRFWGLGPPSRSGGLKPRPLAGRSDVVALSVPDHHVRAVVVLMRSRL